MPAYNEARYVRRALESLFAQTYRSLEIIVVDDGSTDETPQILAGLARLDARVRVLRQTNRGIVGALNTGFTAAFEGAAAYIGRMDANDISRPDRIAAQVEYLEANRDVGLVGTWMRTLTPDGVATRRTWTPPELPGAVAWALHFGTALVHASVLGRRHVFESARLEAGGVYRCDGVEHCEDYDLWVRLLALSVRMANVPQLLYERRDLPKGITPTQAEIQARRSLRIAHRLLGSFSEDDARLLVSLHRRHELSAFEAKRAVDLLLELHRDFAATYPMSLREQAMVADDVTRKLWSRLWASSALRPPVTEAETSVLRMRARVASLLMSRRHARSLARVGCGAIQRRILGAREKWTEV
ncbi:MAG: glycosyltransferase family 2 protein [Deltaproteobacteria bacterium]|nr:glycosyltransferase family 2 protein [Deltaproteobacteria bacterium]